MAITLVQAGSAAGTGGALAYNASGVTAGNLLVISASQFGNSVAPSSFTDTASTPLVASPWSGSAGNYAAGLWYVENASAGAHDFSCLFASGENTTILFAEFSGVAASSALGAVATPGISSGTALLTGTATPSAPGDLAVSVFQQNTFSETISGFTNGFVAATNYVYHAAAMAYTTAGASPISSGATSPSAAGWVSMLALFKSASTAPSLMGQICL